MAQTPFPDQAEGKIMILGAFGVGKSAIFKQLDLKYGSRGQFHEDKVLTHLYRVVHMYDTFAEQVHIEFGTTGNAFYDTFLANGRPRSDQENPQLPEELVNAVLDIWNSESGRKVWEDRTMHNIPDTLSYFLQEDTIQRMKSPGFVLTADDILRQNVRTAGLEEISFGFKGKQVKAYSVSGARNERKKWVLVFEHVSVVFYVLALDDFTKTLFQGGTGNRWEDNLNLINRIINDRSLMDIPFVIFLTKPDVLEQKLEEFEAQGKNLDEYFPELMLGNDYESAAPQLMEYMELQVKRLIPEGRSYIVRIVNATDLKRTPKILEGSMDWWVNAENVAGI